MHLGANCFQMYLYCICTIIFDTNFKAFSLRSLKCDETYKHEKNIAILYNAIGKLVKYEISHIINV